MNAPYRVVVLDDEPWSREVVKSLGKWDDLGLLVVGEADDGDAGLRVIEDTRPDIVITDMRMPGMDGTELLRRIADEYPQLRIVVMSGYDDFAYLRQALQSRAEDYLLKPIDPAELNRTLATCIARLQSEPDRRPVSMRTPLAFADADTLDEYVTHRQRVFAHLLELDAIGVQRTLDDLERVLESGDGGSLSQEVGDRVIHDFVVLLEEFMVRSGTAADPDLLRSRDLYHAASSAPIQTVGRIYRQAIAEIENTRRSRDVLDLDEVRAHIDHYFGDPLSLQSVARLFLVSREHLSRVFKKRFGVTVNDYITERRMGRAQELLRDGDLEIKQIGRMVGYNDLAYFYRVFKKQFGYPPGKAR